MNDEDINIHVRFANDGGVIEIGRLPDGLSPQAWFDRLTRNTCDGFLALAGGRGMFRLSETEIGRLQTLE